MKLHIFTDLDNNDSIFIIFFTIYYNEIFQLFSIRFNFVNKLFLFSSLDRKSTRLNSSHTATDA